MNRLRDETLRMRRPEISQIVHVGWIIASYANADGTNACPGTDTIAGIAGCSEETVSRSKKVLRALGVLHEQRRPNNSSMYTLLTITAQRLDWAAHLHLYTDTRQSRRKKRLKEKEIQELLDADAQEAASEPDAERGPEPDAERGPEPDAERGPGVRNPFPAGGPEPVPAGGTETPGTRSGTGAEPDAERVPEPVPAGGLQSDPYFVGDKGPDHDELDAGAQPQDASAHEAGKDSQPGSGEAGPALRSVPPARGRQRPARSGTPAQPPLLLSVPGSGPDVPIEAPPASTAPELTREQKARLRDGATDDEIQAAIAAYGRATAIDLYGHVLVLPHLNDTSQTGS
ncbi:helix-turn-helix domain-containing protein [Streptomyces sp. NPDC007084]|uniref:helix-turn-helix domain-containing protein n=1 Tax=Streptomyces sp. NPDC007084 TaxID=3154313 RepID=UPI003452370C